MKLWRRGILPLIVIVILFVLCAAGENAAYAQTQMTENASSQVSDTGSKKPGEAGRLGTVRIDYKDNVDGTGPIEGAEFTFYRLNGELRSEAGTVRTDSDGIAAITLKKGTYEVQETEPAPGHEATSGFRLTVPVKNEKGKPVYAITAEPKPVRIPDAPESVPSSESVPEPTPDPVPESTASLEVVPSLKPDSSKALSPTGKPEPRQSKTETELPEIAKDTIPTKTKKETVRQKQEKTKKSAQSVQPAVTSDSGNAVFYTVIIGSTAAVAGSMLWILRKEGKH